MQNIPLLNNICNYCNERNKINFQIIGNNKPIILTLKENNTKYNKNYINIFQNIQYFCCRDNKKIKNINNLQELKILDCNCSIINQIEIYNLLYLDCFNNEKIKQVNHLTKLEVLICENYFKYYNGYTRLCQSGFFKLCNIRYLDCSGNEKINDINHLQKLEKIICRGASGLINDGISKLQNICNYCNEQNKMEIII